MTCNRGNISSSGKQPSSPVITAPVADLLALVAVQSVTEAVEWGRGVMSIVGDGSKRVSYFFIESNVLHLGWACLFVWFLIRKNPKVIFLGTVKALLHQK